MLNHESWFFGRVSAGAKLRPTRGGGEAIRSRTVEKLSTDGRRCNFANLVSEKYVSVS